MKRDDPFSKVQGIFIDFAVTKGWMSKEATATDPPAGFRMHWDDEKIDLQESPDSLGVEDGERVDVSWKS